MPSNMKATDSLSEHQPAMDSFARLAPPGTLRHRRWPDAVLGGIERISRYNRFAAVVSGAFVRGISRHRLR